jgi:hypothetical protein
MDGSGDEKNSSLTISLSGIPFLPEK